MAIIEVVNVSKRFSLQPDRPRSFQELVVNTLGRRRQRLPQETFWALKDVSFSVEQGETLGIIGSNGSGKSTCLKLLARIIEPSSGAIRVQGRVAALLELGTGFHPELTGRENIFLNASVLGLGRREISKRFDDIVSFAELERFIDVPVKFYSSGMYVRLAFATAVNVSPEILLIDEVLAVGDQSFQDKCLERIQELKARGITIVFVSHGLDAVRNLCSRALWLDNGILREDGPTDLVVARYLQHVHDKEEAAAFAQQAAAASPARSEGPAPDTATPPTEPAEAAPAEDPIARYRRRWGSGEAEILDVYLLDREGQRRLLVATGEPLTIVIRYHAHQRIEHPMFGLAIHRGDGLHIAGPNNIFGRFDIPFILGTGEVHYMIDVLPLLEGSYYITAAIYDTAGEHAYDHRALSFPFRVQRGQVAECYGTIYIPARWAHVPIPEPVVEGQAG